MEPKELVRKKICDSDFFYLGNFANAVKPFGMFWRIFSILSVTDHNLSLFLYLEICYQLVKLFFENILKNLSHHSLLTNFFLIKMCGSEMCVNVSSSSHLGSSSL